VRELKVLFLKLRTQRLKLGATQARQNYYFGRESVSKTWTSWRMLKGNFKTLKEFVGVLKNRQAKPEAESALSILDEALQVKFNTKQPLAVLIHQLKWMH